MNATELQDALKTLLEELSYMDADDFDQFDVPRELAEIERISTFDEAGVLTRDRGVVVQTSDGAEFQVTIVQSR